MRKRKVNYPPAKTATKGGARAAATSDPRSTRTPATTIDTRAITGRGDIAVGDRVRIGGGGLYAGELATVTAVTMGVIPSATVRTDDGGSRRLRVIDAEPVGPEPQPER